jgi:hypothetical protein
VSRPGRALPRGKDPGTHCTGGWVGPRAGLDTEATGKNPLPPPGIEPRSPGRPARSQTLYWLRYPAHICRSTIPKLLFVPEFHTATYQYILYPFCFIFLMNPISLDGFSETIMKLANLLRTVPSAGPVTRSLHSDSWLIHSSTRFVRFINLGRYVEPAYCLQSGLRL